VAKKKDPLPARKRDSDRQFGSAKLALAVRNALRPGLSALAVGALGALGALGSMTPARAQQVIAANSTTPEPSADIVEITVTARRIALRNADERKKNSESMVDSVVADEAGLLPDNSVTEVLQRVAGVTMVRFASLGNPDLLSAEGSGIQVRGLSGVDARLNGREVFSASTGQGLSFGDVTPELLAAVDVYKSATADLIEGGSGGQVDLRTHMPFDFDPGVKFQATVNGNYGDLAKKADPGASFLLSDRWTGPWGDFGVLVDVAYSKLDQKEFFIRNEPYYQTAIGGTNYYIPQGFDYGLNQFERTRTGEYVGLQWAPTDNLQVAETFFFSKYQQSAMGDGAFIANASIGMAVDPSVSKFDANNVLVSSPNVFTRNPATFTTTGASSIAASDDDGVNQSYSDTLDASTVVHWKPAEHWDVKGAFQFVNSVSEQKTYDLFATVPAGYGNYGLTETSSQPIITLPASTQALLKDPADYFWQAHQDHRDHHDGEEHAVNLDLKYDISDTGFLRAAQVGGRYADRTEQDDDNSYNWSAFCEPWYNCGSTSAGQPVLASLGSAPTQPGNISYQPWSNFFRGAINNPGGVFLGSFPFANTYNPAANVAQLAATCGTTTNNGKFAQPVNSCIGGQLNLAGTAYIPAYTFGPGEQSYERSSDTAAYGLVRFANDSIVRFDGNFGLRFVKIDNKSQGYFTQSGVLLPGSTPSALQTILFPPEPPYYRTGGRDVSRALPALNIRFKPTDKIFIRAAYTVTLDEPSFYDLRAQGGDGATVSTSTNTTTHVTTITNVQYTNTSGNPTLRPTISHNADLELEWYPSASTSAHLSLFDKKLNDTIVYGNTLQPVPFITASGGVVTQQASVSADYNAPQTATIKGIELGGRTFFDMLPSPFNGLGVEGNYTHINDNNPGNQYTDISGVIHHDTPLVGLSNNSYNASLMFEKPQYSVRLAYNWRSQYLMTTNATGTNQSYTYYPTAGSTGQTIGIALPVYAAAYGQLDFGVAYRPTQHLTFSLDMNNLTNATTKTLMGGYPNGSEYVRSWFTTDRRILLSFRFKL
jgi:iron complex outermembrane receptor protein